MVLTLPLTVIGQMASLAFLLVYSLVTIGHWRIVNKTGARRIILAIAISVNLVLFTLLFRSAWYQSPLSAYALIALLLGAMLIAIGSRRSSGTA